MPPKTKRQQRFMAMCSTPSGRKKASGKCPPVKVAKEFRKGVEEGVEDEDDTNESHDTA